MVWLEEAVGDALEGRGALVLLAGEAGIGKTRLAEEVAAASDALALRGAASPAATLPYGPMLGALRGYLRGAPGALASCGPLQGHLALLLPELGPAVAESDRATLFEALRCALATIAAGSPAVILLDDLQWSDDATLELLGALADPLRELAILVVGAYRSDEVPRAHPLRGLRNELRRGRALRELALEPLDAEGTAALAAEVLGTPAVARARAHGLRPNPGRAVLRRGARRRAGVRRPADRGRARPRARGQRRDPGARDDPRRRAPARRRAVGRGARRRRGRVGGRPALRPRARGDARRRRRAGRAAQQRARGRDRARRGRLPPRAGPRRDLRGRARGRGAGRCTGAWPRPSRLGAVPGSRSPRTGSRRAKAPVRSTRCCARSTSLRPCTPIATRRARRGAHWSCGPKASARTSASRCSSATRAARSSPAT